MKSITTFYTSTNSSGTYTFYSNIIIGQCAKVTFYILKKSDTIMKKLFYILYTTVWVNAGF